MDPSDCHDLKVPATPSEDRCSAIIEDEDVSTNRNLNELVPQSQHRRYLLGVNC